MTVEEPGMTEMADQVGHEVDVAVVTGRWSAMTWMCSAMTRPTVIAGLTGNLKITTFTFVK